MQIYVRSLPSSKTTVRGMNQLLTGMDSSTLWEFLNLEGAEILNHYSYDAFGNIIQKMEKVENRFCYNGEMLDLVTQQYYLRARFYNPVIGRFTQEDTYYGDGLNLYQYCQANPVGYVDPSGHTCEIVQNHYKQYQEYRKQHPKATVAEAYEAVTGKDPLKKDAGKSGRYSKTYYEETTKVGGQINDISRTVHQRNDIDWNRIDPATGLTNKQLAQAGSAPYANDGTKIELHHLLQQEPGPMVEIPASLHYMTLHGLVGDGESFRNNPDLEKQYNNFRAKYWRWRAKNL